LVSGNADHEEDRGSCRQAISRKSLKITAPESIVGTAAIKIMVRVSQAPPTPCR